MKYLKEISHVLYCLESCVENVTEVLLLQESVKCWHWKINSQSVLTEESSLFSHCVVHITTNYSCLGQAQ